MTLFIYVNFYVTEVSWRDEKYGQRCGDN